MNNNIYSTFLPIFSQQYETSTMKRVSSAILPSENTDTNIGMSIFNLPEENIRKLEKQNKKELLIQNEQYDDKQ